MKFIKLFMVVSALLLSQWVTAQNGIMDISVIPLVPDSVTPTGMVDVSFEIKLQQPQNIQKMFVLIGSQPDDGGIFLDSVLIVPDSLGYSTQYYSQQFAIEQYRAHWVFRLSDAQWSQYAYITVYGLLNNATETTRLYWQKSSQ